MPSHEEKRRRKELLHSLRRQERRKKRDAFPAAVLLLKGLFDFLDQQLSQSECDDSLRLTRDYLRRNAMDEALVIEWLEKHGGYCDCEALDNVEPIVAEAMPGFDQIGKEVRAVN